MAMNNGHAQVLHPVLKQPPILTPGEITPEVLVQWDSSCQRYFTHKGVAVSERIEFVSAGFQDPLVQAWFNTNNTALNALSWTEFLNEIRATFLEDNWDRNIRSQMLALRMRPGVTFANYVRDFEMRNILLAGTLLHFNDAALREQITARLSDRLQVHAYTDTVLAITDYNKWKRAMVQEDKIWSAKRSAEVQELSLMHAKFAKLSASSQSPAYPNPTSRLPASSAPAPANPELRIHVPGLTEAERQLLRDHKGCFRCRKFYAGHLQRDCKDWPDRGIKTLTLADALSAQKLDEKGKRPHKVAAISGPEASLSNVDSDDDDDAGELAYMPTAPVAAVYAASAYAVAALGTDEYDVWYSEYVSPPTAPHLVWNMHIASSPVLDAVDGLIDTGAPVNLVSEATVQAHNLRRRPLHKPWPFTDAFAGREQQATEWCKFVVTAPDGSYSSRAIRAVIVPTLCYPVILGVPFLSQNKLLVDVSRRALWTEDNVNILSPSTQQPPSPPVSASLRRAFKREEDLLRDHLRLAQHRDLLRDIKLNIPATTAEPDLPGPPPVIAAVRQRVEELAFLEKLQSEDAAFKAKFSDCFPSDIPHLDHLPSDIYHEINLKDANMTIVRRQYDCPKKYREAFKTLLTQHLEAGRLRESSSPYASPCFLVPKADPTALPRWVNDYRALNENTVPDVHPLPSIQEILSDCGRGKIWGKLDMTNSFFQTRVHPDHIKYTAITTPFGLYEWTVMPQGCRNAPSTHQRRMYSALRQYIGNICHVYLDDIIIWSQTLEEHKQNVETILNALRKNNLFCSLKKTDLFCVDLTFLGHHISRDGITPDGSKVDKVVSWPTPKSAQDVRSFLGLVRYISNFLPGLAHHTALLNPLTSKEAERDFVWTPAHNCAFEATKRLVVSHECLTTIDHSNLGDNRIFVSTDASDYCTGAVLSYGPTLDSARPVAFESAQLSGAELNYPVHEKELLAIVRALKKWRVDLLGVPFVVFTDHRTLENFNHQKHLSRRQARWQEFLGQYDFVITYLKGADNSVADALSRLAPPTSSDPCPEPCAPYPIAALRLLRRANRALITSSLPLSVSSPVAALGTLTIASDPAWLTRIRDGYTDDRWCLCLLRSLTADNIDPIPPLRAGLLDGASVAGVSVRDGLLFVGDRLCIPRVTEIREALYRIAHDSMGHFGAEKSYASLRDAYYWPHMRRDLEKLYVPGCEPCQRNKSPTTKPRGPLHPLPVPTWKGQRISIDFVGKLPLDNGYDCLCTITCRLGSEVCLIPCRYDMSAEEFAELFFVHWYCENGLPIDIVSDRDKLFLSRFWKALHRLTGVDLKMSTSYHPETDGSSERTNRTVIQMIRYHVERNQTGWSRALPLIRFQIMNTPNASTGFTPFQLRHGASPRVIPPLVQSSADEILTDFAEEGERARALLQRIENDVLEAQDNLLLAKTQQAMNANTHRGPEMPYAVGDQVLLSTFHRRRDFCQRGDGRTAKFMVRYDGPHTVVRSNPATSNYTLDLPASTNVHPTFHASLLRPFIPNDDQLFPSRVHDEPGPIVTPDGQEEFFVDRILDRRRRGRGWQYLVRWRGYGPGADTWLAGSEVSELEALDTFLHDHSLSA